MTSLDGGVYLFINYGVNDSVNTSTQDVMLHFPEISGHLLFSLLHWDLESILQTGKE